MQCSARAKSRPPPPAAAAAAAASGGRMDREMMKNRISAQAQEEKYTCACENGDKRK
jgi:hypothetical protein